MALSPIITSISYNADGTEATITDTTVYGSPNAARADVAVYFQLWKMDADENEEVVEVDNDYPETADSWSFNSSTDGWYRGLITIIPEYATGNYTVGQVVSYNGDLYISILNGSGNPIPTDTTYFSPIDFDDEDILDANNVTYKYQDYLVLEQSKKCAAETAGDWYNEQNCSNCKKVDFASALFQRRAMIIAAQYFASINVYSKAEEIARNLETACESC